MKTINAQDLSVHQLHYRRAKYSNAVALVEANKDAIQAIFTAAGADGVKFIDRNTELGIIMVINGEEKQLSCNWGRTYLAMVLDRVHGGRGIRYTEKVQLSYNKPFGKKQLERVKALVDTYKTIAQKKSADETKMEIIGSRIDEVKAFVQTVLTDIKRSTTFEKFGMFDKINKGTVTHNINSITLNFGYNRPRYRFSDEVTFASAIRVDIKFYGDITISIDDSILRGGIKEWTSSNVVEFYTEAGKYTQYLSAVMVLINDNVHNTEALDWVKDVREKLEAVEG